MATTRSCSPCFGGGLRSAQRLPHAVQPTGSDRSGHPSHRLIVAVRKLHIVLPALFEAGTRLEYVYD
ncbi:hypothetical protein X770_25900 [Mesorhizobium sp. LSJC269B00]|uniref:hypothetical protein n=1 Tax=unclassified Mesorhizobium TaxID=325217 RepID=UPI0003CE0983|nr:hypothetical protein [Mesorhizobium sp. LSJC269B00]ESW83562.1 hypothetical protein X770_25900 [Mesorhizobium sp. LSJC269B00]